MAIEQREMKIASEVDDVMVMIVELVKDIKDGKDAGTIASENLAHLMKAIEGAQHIPSELSSDRGAVMCTVGYRAGDLINALIGGAEEVA